MIRYVLIGVGIIAVVPVAWLAWWLLSPLFITKEVHDEFPLAARANIPDHMTMAEVEDVMSAAAGLERPVSEEMPEMSAPVADFPKVESSGVFQDADAFHKGSGMATIYNLGADAQLVLRLEDFQVTNGPDLRVLLAYAAAPESREDLADAGYVELGKLKGNVGSQNYEIPDTVSLDDVMSVVIYCNPFHVIFSVATLEDQET